MIKTGQGGGELKRNRNRQQSKEFDSILQPHKECMEEQLQLQGTCIARFAILCYQSTSLVVFRLARHQCSSTSLVYMWRRTYVIFLALYFCMSLVFDRVPNFTITESSRFAIITRFIPENKLFTALSSFVVQLNSRTSWSVISIRVSGGSKLMHNLSQL